MRIVVGAIIQESNHFIPDHCTLDHFAKSYLLTGHEVVSRLAHTRTEMAGFLDAAATERAVVCPTVGAHAVSYGPLSAHTYAVLKETLLRTLSEAGPVDGVLLALHGSMAAEEEDDPEGDLLEAVRAQVGRVPIAASLDLHAHVTRRMVAAADILVGYRNYPHDDTYETGWRTAQLLFRTISGEIRPVMHLAKAPMVVSVGNMQTAFGPMGAVADYARALEQTGQVLSASYFGVQPWLDVPDMGFASVVVTDGPSSVGADLAHQIVRIAWEHRKAFQEVLVPPREAVRQALAAPPGPVLLVDSADSPGAGAAGDSPAVLQALLEEGVAEPCLAGVVDPVVARVAASAGVGARVHVTVGNRITTGRGTPVSVTGTVRHITEGRFRYAGGLLEGVEGQMGLSAVLEVGTIQLLVTSHATYEWDDAQYRSVGLEPTSARIVGVKMPLNYKFTYRQIANTMIVLDTPGPASPNLLALPYRRISRPVFPFDPDTAFEL